MVCVNMVALTGFAAILENHILGPGRAQGSAERQRFCPDFAGTACETICRAKNSRNTCPKINSSANNATATEKIRPATTAMNVITSCILPSQNKF
jgi:hypothetical protein